MKLTDRLTIAAGAFFTTYEGVKTILKDHNPEYGSGRLLPQPLIHSAASATAELVSEFAHRGDPLPRIGSHWIACDSTGAPRIIIRSTALRIGPFASADAAFAFAEGEDNRTLESWQREHRRYWERTSAARGAAWSESEDIVFEYFAVVWPPEHAD